MARHKKNTQAYLSFTRKERVAIIAVIVIMMVYPCIPFLYTVFNKPKPVDHKAFEKEIAELKLREQDSSKAYTAQTDEYGNTSHYFQPSEKNYYNKVTKGELFYFDPNSLSEAGWIKLGIREKTAKTIRNYVSKGGRFYKPEDISKIWGLHQDEVDRLIPYIRIETKPASGNNTYPDLEKGKTYEKSKHSITVVDINTADTSAFIALPGIGSKLAARIIAFREKLGGFYKIEQVAETYALPDSTFQKIKTKLVVGNSQVKKLNINTANVDELKTHPYLRYNLANAIIQYRTQHGNFSSVADIKKIMMVTDEMYSKVAPYLTLK
jgi:competence ComEA-like helix-hairpin-helix protein